MMLVAPLPVDRRAFDRRQTAELSISGPGTAPHFDFGGATLVPVDFTYRGSASFGCISDHATAQQSMEEPWNRRRTAEGSISGPGKAPHFDFGGAIYAGSSQFCSGSASFGCISDLAAARQSTKSTGRASDCGGINIGTGTARYFV
ncbi:hypothetical protein THAOC_00334 [Thalassiosira oceanica]|uniref:Uncharacterized protein n=1 Tax=Thalassiosira oceanica TaxID=159749 RepID=K0TPC4_THAOC|nr:hypothetical protein THAOC_00334 [Thalassiosira oceanica]|eukprot:EJK77811.1 hypothetical protein THAOC_00334 [Thalassiosira oceanica]